MFKMITEISDVLEDYVGDTADENEAHSPNSSQLTLSATELSTHAVDAPQKLRA
jgi:hypothetical protein